MCFLPVHLFLAGELHRGLNVGIAWIYPDACRYQQLFGFELDHSLRWPTLNPMVFQGREWFPRATQNADTRHLPAPRGSNGLGRFVQISCWALPRRSSG